MNDLTEESKTQLLCLIQHTCQEDPKFVRRAIDASTHGVKTFADKQSDKASKLAFMMTVVLDANKKTKKFGPFSRREIVDYLAPWFEGTDWYKEELKKL